MSENEMDANQGEVETPADSSAVENEQAQIGSEAAKTPVAGSKDWQTKYQETLAALRQERQEKQALREQVQQVQAQPDMYQAQPDYAPEGDDATVRRFLRAEADAQVAKKLATDPTFRDRVDLVEAEMMRSGRTLEDADNAVVAKVLRQALVSQPDEAVPSNQPRQLRTTATPEPEPIDRNPNYRDLMRGKGESEEAKLMREAMKRVRGV